MIRLKTNIILSLLVIVTFALVIFEIGDTSKAKLQQQVIIVTAERDSLKTVVDSMQVEIDYLRGWVTSLNFELSKLKPE